MAEPWNHDTHYHALVLRAAPPAARRSLDAVCGEGTLAAGPPRNLRERLRVPSVPRIRITDRPGALPRDLQYISGLRRTIGAANGGEAMCWPTLNIEGRAHYLEYGGSA